MTYEKPIFPKNLVRRRPLRPSPSSGPSSRLSHGLHPRPRALPTQPLSPAYHRPPTILLARYLLLLRFFIRPELPKTALRRKPRVEAGERGGSHGEYNYRTLGSFLWLCVFRIEKKLEVRHFCEPLNTLRKIVDEFSSGAVQICWLHTHI